MKKVLILCACILLLSGCANRKMNETTSNENKQETTTTSTTTTTSKIHKELIGLYKDTVNDGSTPSEIELKENNEFEMSLNLCEGMTYIIGTYEVNNQKIILNFEAGQFRGFEGEDLTTLTFEIINNQKLKFISNTVCCGPYKNAAFKKIK